MKKTAVIIFCLLTVTGFSARAQWDKEVFSIRGQMALQEGKYSNAIQHFNILARLDSTDYWTFFYRGIAKYNLGDIRGALSDFDNTIRLNPVFTNGYHFRGITYSRFGQYEKAFEDFRSAIELRPGNIGIYFSRGVAHFLSQNFEQALKDFNFYIDREDSDASAYLNRGATELFLKDTLSALDDYNKAIRLNFRDAEGYMRRGRLYAAQNRYEDAIRDMDKAIEYEPDNTLAYFTRAIMFHETSNYNAAMEDFNKVLELEPGNALTLFNRSLLNARVGNFEDALDDIDRVIAINPDNVLAHYNRGAIFMELERYQDAIDDYTRAIALYPDFANAYMSRSAAESRLGRTGASKSDYETARRKIAEYKEANRKNYGSYADTTKKYSSLLEFDAEFAKKDFNNEVIQSRDIDVALRPLYKFILTDETGGGTTTLESLYENLLLERFKSNSPIAISLTNSTGQGAIDFGHSIGYILAGDSSSGAGQSNLTSAQDHFIRGLNDIANKQFNNALEHFDAAVSLADNKEEKDRYSHLYKAFYLMGRAVLRAEMIEFIANIQTNVSTLNMDDKGVARTRVKDHIINNFDYSEAIEDLQTAAAILPMFPFIHFDLGNLYTASNKPIEAIENYTKAIESYPAMGDAYLNRGLVQIVVKETEKGCIDLSKAGELGVGEAYRMIAKYCKSDE